jgi:hypothetical protein
MNRTGAVWIFGLSLLAGCQPAGPSPNRFRIVARNYAFGAPETLPPGETFFQLVNEGTVRHEVQLYRFKPGVSRDSALHMLANDNIPDETVDTDGGVLISGPSDSALQQLVAQLKVGEVYGLECAFRDGPGKPAHSRLGMFSVFEVK